MEQETQARREHGCRAVSYTHLDVYKRQEGFQGEGEPSENPDTIAKVNVREGREVNYTKIVFIDQGL